MENLREHDGELRLLGHFLKRVAAEAKVTIDAIPVNASVREECAIVETASAAVYTIAERIVSLKPESDDGEKIVERARLWLDGRYWQEVA